MRIVRPVLARITAALHLRNMFNAFGQKRKIKSQIETLSNGNRITTKRKIPDEMRKKGHDSILQRWQDDDLFRDSLIVVGWNEEYCRYLDSLLSTDFSYTATRTERERYENNLTPGVNGQGHKSGPMKNRTDFSHAVHHLAAIKTILSQTFAIPTTCN